MATRDDQPDGRCRAGAKSSGQAWRQRPASSLVDRRRGRGGASLVVLPELFLSGYDIRGIIAEPVDHVVTAGDETCACLQKVCADLSIGAIIGAAVGLGGGIANGALVIAPDGSLVHVYSKVRLWGEEARPRFSTGTAVTICVVSS